MTNGYGPSGKIRFLLIAVVLIYCTVLIFLPLAGLFYGALAEGVRVFWREVTCQEAINALKLTAIITFIVTAINTVAGTVMAFLIVRRRFPGRRIINGLIDLPFAVSPVVAGFMVVLLFGPEGILRVFTEPLGLKVLFALPGMIFATLFVTLPFVVREVVLVLEEAGSEQEEAARMLGATPWQTFIKITFPRIFWGLVYGVMLTVARSFGEFGAVLVVSGNIMNLTQSATLYIYQNYMDFNNTAVSALSLVLAVLSFAILVALERLKRKKGGRCYDH